MDAKIECRYRAQNSTQTHGDVAIVVIITISTRPDPIAVAVVGRSADTVSNDDIRSDIARKQVL